MPARCRADVYKRQAQGTYKGEEFLDAAQITKNKLCIYTREKNTGFDRRFLMKRVGEGWMIDAVQELSLIHISVVLV